MSLLSQLASLACAGAMMVSGGVNDVCPQNDVNDPLFLVNREWRISEYYVPTVEAADVPGQLKRMIPEAKNQLEALFAAAKEETGKTMTSVSGYRAYSKQAVIYNRKLKNVGSKAKADEYVARPGASEHQTGLAMDVGQRGASSNLNGSYGKSATGIWLVDNAWRFGFIIRYKEGWEDITGYNYEPWHIRYVGVDDAKAMYELNIPMETYLQQVREKHLIELANKNP